MKTSRNRPQEIRPSEEMREDFDAVKAGWVVNKKREAAASPKLEQTCNNSYYKYHYVDLKNSFNSVQNFYQIFHLTMN